MNRFKQCIHLLSAVLLCASISVAHANTDKEKIAVVNEMIKAWHDMDWDRVADLFTEQGSLHSMMKDPIVGREVLRAYLKKLVVGLERIELQVSTIGILDGKVFIERVDDFHVNGKHGRIPVVGVLEIENGKVKEWREYYDRAQLLREMGVAEMTPAKKSKQ